MSKMRSAGSTASITAMSPSRGAARAHATAKVALVARRARLTRVMAKASKEASAPRVIDKTMIVRVAADKMPGKCQDIRK